MRDRAARYASIERSRRKPNDTILVAHVRRTPKGKIRLVRVDIRMKDKKEEVVTEVSRDDPRYVFEDDYKIRKVAHDLVKRSARFGSFYDCSTRVFYDPE